MITLYTTFPQWGLPSFSPACMKLETWLRMAKLSYKRVTELHLHCKKAPKGKIPFIDYQGKLIGDSTLIIDMLKEKEGIDLDRGLTASERAKSLAFRRMLKENTYWGLVDIRYNVEENWRVYREVLASLIYPAVSPTKWEPVVEHFGERIRNQMYGHGMGRHSSSEICQIISADFQALSDFLADKQFFMGERPTTLDATAYAFIGNFIKQPLLSPIIDYIMRLENLCQHYERMKQEFFSDIESHAENILSGQTCALNTLKSTITANRAGNFSSQGNLEAA